MLLLLEYSWEMDGLLKGVLISERFKIIVTTLKRQTRTLEYSTVLGSHPHSPY